MIYCPNCGTSNRDGSRFCNECGTPLVQPSSIPERPPTVARPQPSEAALPPERPDEEAKPGEGERVQEVLEAAALSAQEEITAEPVEPDIGEALPVSDLAEPVLSEVEGPIPSVAPPVPGVAEESEEEGEGPAEVSAEPLEPALREEPEEAAPVEAPAEPEVEAPPQEAELEEGEPAKEERPAPSAMEILAGIEDALPVAPIIAKPHSAPLAPPTIPGADFESARLFEEIVVSRPAVEVPVPEGRWTRLWRWARLRLVYLLVALAVIAPFLVGGIWSWANLPVAPDVKGVYEAVEALPEGAAVLVAYDYDPATVGELRPQALALTHHLMARGLRIMTLSLLPEGPALAQDIFQQAAPAHPEVIYGRNYINLGYLAGQEAALRAFARDPLDAVRRDYVTREPLADFAALKGVEGIEDVALIIELAGNQESPRRWIEQVGSRYDVGLVAGVTAAAEPQVRPYYQSGQLGGLISGLPGAAQYELLIRRPASGVASLGAQSAAHLVIILLALLGSLVYWIGERRRES
jgi:hypothetical protein